MTMVPVPTTLYNQQHYDGGGGGGGGAGGIGGGAFGDCFISGGSLGLLMSQIATGGYEYEYEYGSNRCSDAEACIGTDPVEVGIGGGSGNSHNHMAEDDSRTSSLNEAGSSSKRGDVLPDQEEHGGDEDWLQLGIGGGAGRTETKLQESPEPTNINGTRRAGLVELDLLPPGGGGGGGGSESGAGAGVGAGAQLMIHKVLDPTTHRPPIAITPPPPLFLQHQFPNPITRPTSLTGLSFPPQPDFPWGYIRSNPNPSSSTTPSSSMLPVPYFVRPFQHPSLDLAGPSSSSSDVRIIDAPPRPHSGVWFVLQASPNQAKEPFLPQIPKNFLRIKDGRMTVRLLMKYLVNKLKLDSESEVEIRCRGQQLLPFWTLQHVRDNIWRSRDAATLIHETSSTTDHVMVLHYGWSS